jgi:hypothetical protein
MKLRLKLTNATHYLTSDLRSLVLAGIRREGFALDALWRVSVAYQKGSGRCGWGRYHSTRFEVRLPRWIAPAPGESRFEQGAGGSWCKKPLLPRTDGLTDKERDYYAHVVLHEIGHCRGLKHGEMHRSAFHAYSYDVAWAAGIAIRAKPVAARATPDDRRSERIASAEKIASAKVAQWTTKAKLAATKLRVWRRKLRAAEGRKAALTAGTLPSIAPRVPRPKREPLHAMVGRLGGTLEHDTADLWFYDAPRGSRLNNDNHSQEHMPAAGREFFEREARRLEERAERFRAFTNQQRQENKR